MMIIMVVVQTMDSPYPNALQPTACLRQLLCRTWAAHIPVRKDRKVRGTRFATDKA